jgi:hypothetical protein
MTLMRVALISSAVAVSTLFISAVLSYLFLWHLAGLDSVGPADGAGAAMGAFPVLVKAIALGAISSFFAFVFSLIYLRRRKSA